MKKDTNFNMKNDTNSYKGWLNSDYFLKRILAVFGYQTLGLILIYIVFGLPATVVTIVLGGQI